MQLDTNGFWNTNGGRRFRSFRDILLMNDVGYAPRTSVTQMLFCHERMDGYASDVEMREAATMTDACSMNTYSDAIGSVTSISNFNGAQIRVKDELPEDMRCLGGIEKDLAESINFLLLRDEAIGDTPPLTTKFLQLREDALHTGSMLHKTAILNVGSHDHIPASHVVKCSVMIWALYVKLLDKFLVNNKQCGLVNNIWNDEEFSPDNLVTVRTIACTIYLIAWKVEISTATPSIRFIKTWLHDYCHNRTPVGQKRLRISNVDIKGTEIAILNVLEWQVTMITVPNAIVEMLAGIKDISRYLQLEATAITMSQKASIDTAFTYTRSSTLVKTSIMCICEAALDLGIEHDLRLSDFFALYRHMKIETPPCCF
jgi:hypothetical protein